MMRYSPLRYPGGKGKISSFFSELFVANNLIGGTYIEPYVGGGSIALSLLINGVANQIIINDKDRSLFVSSQKMAIDCNLYLRCEQKF